MSSFTGTLTQPELLADSQARSPLLHRGHHHYLPILHAVKISFLHPQPMFPHFLSFHLVGTAHRSFLPFSVPHSMHSECHSLAISSANREPHLRPALPEKASPRKGKGNKHTNFPELTVCLNLRPCPSPSPYPLHPQSYSCRIPTGALFKTGRRPVCRRCDGRETVWFA
jgi:hypothetical protein